MKQHYFSQENFGGLGDLEALNALRQANGKDPLETTYGPNDKVQSEESDLMGAFLRRNVRAKFTCNSITNYPKQKQAHLSATTRTDGENKDFTMYTPYGDMKINIEESTAAFDFFKPGKSYYLVFEEAPDK